MAAKPTTKAGAAPAKRTRRTTRRKKLTLAERIQKNVGGISVNWVAAVAVIGMPAGALLILQFLQTYVDTELPLYVGNKQVRLVDLAPTLLDAEEVRLG